jgi:hypothetical protein
MELEFGLFAVEAETRTVRGIIIPWNEASAVSSTGNASLTFRPEDIRVPRDPSVVVLNRQHDRYDPIGGGVKFDASHEKGLYAEYRIAETEEGDAWLADHGQLVRLSPELRDITRHADGHATATLTGSALVEAGAFASAGLFAIGEVQEQEEETPTSDVDEVTPETESESVVTDSIVPEGVITPEANKVDTSASAFYTALARGESTGDFSSLKTFQNVDAAKTGMFAAYAPLTDITATGAAVTTQAQFVGEIYGKKAFQQKVLPLFAHDNLTALKVEGWAWVATPEVGPYAGDKAAVPSNAPTFTAVSTTAERIAGAHDIDRALRDFGNEGFWSGYFRGMTESYAKQADAKVYAKIAAATTTVAPGTVPSGVDAGSAALVDGALAVIDAGYIPSFALVSPAIYRSLLLTKKDQTLEFLSQSMGLEEGQLANFKFVPHASLAAKRVIVGAKEAATVYELPGAPIRIEGLDVAHGGIDPAVFGYIATIINDSKALASVTTA